jgi:phage/plasmid-like protein (TIGR03299 family)
MVLEGKMHGLFENDTMVSAHGIRPWHGIGTVVDGAMTSDEALRLARLDWKVIPTPIYTEGAMTAARLIPSQVPASVPGFVANVRGDTNEVLGVVSDKYRIAQNEDAFHFADDLLSLGEAEGARYETAGSLFNGRKVFMLINLPEARILDDPVERFLALANSHDGSGALKVFTTGVRIVCNNTLNMALDGAVRGVSIRHMSSMGVRQSEALRAMGVSARYFAKLGAFAEQMAGKKVDADQLLSKLYPEDSKWTLRQKQSNNDIKAEVVDIFRHKDDLANFRGSAWAFIQAVADRQSNAAPRRRTQSYADRKMLSFIEGDNVVTTATRLAVAA